MSELLSETYQSGIYWAALNAEQARERAANAELDYWTRRAEKDGLVVRVERTDGPESTEDDGIRAGREEVSAPPLAPGEQPRDPLDDNYQTWIAAQPPAPPAQERASEPLTFERWFELWDTTHDPEIKRLCGIAWATAAKQAKEEALDAAYTAVWQLWNRDDKNQSLADALYAIRNIPALAAHPAPQKSETK